MAWVRYLFELNHFWVRDKKFLSAYCIICQNKVVSANSSLRIICYHCFENCVKTDLMGLFCPYKECWYVKTCFNGTFKVPTQSGWWNQHTLIGISMYISESKKALAPNAAHDSVAKFMLYQFYCLNQFYGLYWFNSFNWIYQHYHFNRIYLTLFDCTISFDSLDSFWWQWF